MDHDTIIAALESIGAALEEKFRNFNPGRLAQATSAMETLRMSVDSLYTEVPYRTHIEG